jgi:hypothetical protein
VQQHHEAALHATNQETIGRGKITTLLAPKSYHIAEGVRPSSLMR